MPPTQKTHLENLREFAKPLYEIRKNPIYFFQINPIDRPPCLKVHEDFYGKQFENLDVIIQSGGGDIESAYLIFKILRNHCKKLSILIPIWAKSAATLICLGADELILGELGELGPLDTQSRLDGTAEFKSALNAFSALQEVKRHGFETLEHAVENFFNKPGIKMQDAITMGIAYTTGVCGPLYQQINTEKLGELSRQLERSKAYGIRILTRYMKWSEKAAATTMEKIVREYPSHEFILDIEELKELGFPARSPTREEESVLEAFKSTLLEIEQECRKSEEYGIAEFLTDLESPSVQEVKPEDPARHHREIDIKSLLI